MMSERDSPSSTIVRAVRASVGDLPIVLCGSRATGEANELSDWDLFVVMPFALVPFSLGRLSRTARELEAALDTSVSINPLPAFRLAHPGRSLLVWKLREEGRLLNAPSGFSLAQRSQITLTDERANSYALSGLRYLIAHVTPADLARSTLSATQARDVRKALLHSAQLRLLETGLYASRLDDALIMLGYHSPAANGLQRLALSTDSPDTWFAVRDLLTTHVHIGSRGRAASFLTNLQYATLSWVSKRPSWWALRQPSEVSTCLGRAVVLLSLALTPSGAVDEDVMQTTVRTLPAPLCPDRPPDWIKLRDTIEAEWPAASPLVGL